MGLQLNDTSKFFNKLQSSTINNDGILNQREAETSYKNLLANDPCGIPPEIKDKFGSGGLNSDTFNSIDRLGTKDGFINDQELFKHVKGDSGFKPYTPPLGNSPAPSFAKAGYLVERNGHADAKASAKAMIQDVGSILGTANDGRVADNKLSKEETDHAITLIRANSDTVQNADGKAKLLQSLDQNFDANSKDGYITKESLTKVLRGAPTPKGEGWA
jgi:hypothetical protein